MVATDPNQFAPGETAHIGLTSTVPVHPTAHLAVLFADVVGSTKLYDTLGDVTAKQMIDECLAVLTGVAHQYGGRVIKTIGDEIMCALPSADSGCLAAMDMHHKVMALPAVSQVKRSVRIGFHFGPVIEENSDVFGDTVNVAARMAGLAKGMQIITTGATVSRMSQMLQLSTRAIAALSVKGKGDEVSVSEVIWQGGDELTMTTSSQAFTNKVVSLRVEHAAHGRAWVVDNAHTSIVLGRDAQCDVVIADRNASRQHARIECRRDKFFLVDQSTNGTFIVMAGEAEVLLRREEIMLRGAGRIGFGHSVNQPDAEFVSFVLQG
jgi:class 3 adenylate cyclase